MRFHASCVCILVWFGLVCTWEDRLGWISGFWLDGKRKWDNIYMGLVGLDEGVYGVSYLLLTL